MSINRCPVCGATALSVWSKLAAKSLRCVHCRTALRLRFVPTAALAALAYGSILFVGLYRRADRASILFAASCLLVLLLAYVLMPLEVREPGHGAPPGTGGSAG